MIKVFKQFFIRRYFKKKFAYIQISRNCNFEFYENIVFKGTCYIGPDAYWSAKGLIVIGNNVIFGPRTILWTYNHNYTSEESIPYGGNDITGKIQINDNVWVGLNVLILQGVTIGEGAVVGANSVVTKDVPPGAIIVGNPAKVVKYRDEEIYNKLKKEKKFYLDYKYKVNK